MEEEILYYLNRIRQDAAILQYIEDNVDPTTRFPPRVTTYRQPVSEADTNESTPSLPLFQFEVLPFGLSNVAATLQQFNSSLSARAASYNRRNRTRRRNMASRESYHSMILRCTARHRHRSPSPIRSCCCCLTIIQELSLQEIELFTTDCNHTICSDCAPKIVIDPILHERCCPVCRRKLEFNIYISSI